MDYFAGLDISMDETQFGSRPRRRGRLREQDGVDSGGDRRGIGESARVSADRIRDRTDGADRLPRVEATGPSGGLRRKPAGLRGAQVAGDPQDRSQRRARASALACTGFFKPVHVSHAGPRRPLADHRSQEAGRPASDLGKSDPRFGGRVRDPAAWALSLPPSWGGLVEAGGGVTCLLRRHARTDCGANRGDDRSRGDRRRHQAHDDGLGSLPKAHGDRRLVGQLTPLPLSPPSTIPHASADLARRRRLSGPRSNNPWNWALWQRC